MPRGWERLCLLAWLSQHRGLSLAQHGGSRQLFGWPQELPCPAPGTDGLYTENLGKKNCPQPFCSRARGEKPQKPFWVQKFHVQLELLGRKVC